MPLGIDPTVDYAFKKLFGDPDNSDLLIHLLNAVLSPQSPIVEVAILNPFNEKEFPEDKLSVLDLKARDSAGAWYNVEMQTKAMPVLRQRLPYYNALLYTSQLTQGVDYTRLTPAITVCFLGEVLFRETNSPHLSFSFHDRRHDVRLSDFMQIHTVELPKYNFDERSIATAEPLTQWSFFFSRAAEYEVGELTRLLPGRTYTKATGIMEMIAHSPEQREAYEARRKAELDYQSFIIAARDEGLEEGRLEGAKSTLAQQIRLLQESFGQEVTEEAELLTLDLDSLQGQFKQLVDRLASR